MCSKRERQRKKRRTRKPCSTTHRDGGKEVEVPFSLFLLYFSFSSPPPLHYFFLLPAAKSGKGEGGGKHQNTTSFWEWGGGGLLVGGKRSRQNSLPPNRAKCTVRKRGKERRVNNKSGDLPLIRGVLPLGSRVPGAQKLKLSLSLSATQLARRSTVPLISGCKNRVFDCSYLRPSSSTERPSLPPPFSKTMQKCEMSCRNVESFCIRAGRQERNEEVEPPPPPLFPPRPN